MNKRWRNWPFAALGSCGAIGSMGIANGCSGACSACFGCLIAGGSLALMALGAKVKKAREERADGMAEADH